MRTNIEFCELMPFTNDICSRERRVNQRREEIRFRRGNERCGGEERFEGTPVIHHRDAALSFGLAKEELGSNPAFPIRINDEIRSMGDVARHHE